MKVGIINNTNGRTNGEYSKSNIAFQARNLSQLKESTQLLLLRQSSPEPRFIRNMNKTIDILKKEGEMPKGKWLRVILKQSQSLLHAPEAYSIAKFEQEFINKQETLLNALAAASKSGDRNSQIGALYEIFCDVIPSRNFNVTMKERINTRIVDKFIWGKVVPLLKKLDNKELTNLFLNDWRMAEDTMFGTYSGRFGYTISDKEAEYARDIAKIRMLNRLGDNSNIAELKNYMQGYYAPRIQKTAENAIKAIELRSQAKAQATA